MWAWECLDNSESLPEPRVSECPGSDSEVISDTELALISDSELTRTAVSERVSRESVVVT